MRFNYNDGGRSNYFKGNVNDCVVRAIAIANNLDYKEVYDNVNKKLKSYGYPSVRNKGVPKFITRELLKEYGWEWVPVMKIGSGCEMHLNEDELEYFNDTTIIVQVSKHISCIKNGIINDTFDCSRGGTRCVYGYYIKR